MIIKVRRPNYFPAVTDRFFSGKRLVKSCRACAVEDYDYFVQTRSCDRDASFNKALNVLENVLPDTQRRDDNLFYKFSSKLTNKLMEKIRRAFTYFPKEKDTQELVLPVTALNGTIKKIPVTHRDNLLSHNRDLIRNIIGIESSSHFKHVDAYRKLFSGRDLQALFSYKLKILKTFAEYLERSQGNFDFIYTKNEIKYLRTLAAQYDALHSLMLENGVKTKEIETFLFSDIQKAKVGERLPNGDTVVSKTSVFDKQSGRKEPAIMGFSNTNMGFRFKLYASMDDLIDEKDKLKQQFYYFLRTNNIKGINRLNEKIAGYTSDSGIAEVFVDVNNLTEMRKVLAGDSALSAETVASALGDGEKFYYIHNLMNFNPERYYNVSVELIAAMKRFGMENKIDTAFIDALAYGKSKHSPVGLYLRAGCEPLSETRENIENQIYGSPSGFDYKKNVWLKYDICGKIKT